MSDKESVDSVNQSQTLVLDSDVRDLLKSVEASFTIECESCGYDDIITDGSEWAAAKKLSLVGWRIVNDNEAWCDECVTARDADAEDGYICK